MEWNTRWELENLDIFSSKGMTSPKKLHLTDWGIDEGEEDIDGSFNLSGVVGGSGGSASDVGNSSVKSSISASVCSGEASIGLKLGKRTYFENNFACSSTKTSSFSEVPVSIEKKVKSSCQSTPILRCQVEGCNLDLSSAKDYHRKHKVCENHSKCPKVVVAGFDRRFCQQCSRFHSLSEFDDKKRSCRRRLSDHNARRRKPQQETIRFNSTTISSSFYDGQQQLSFALNNGPVIQARPAVNSALESTWNSNYSVLKVKSEKSRELDGLSHSLGIHMPNAVSMPTPAFNRLVSSKGTRGELPDPGFSESLSSNDLRRALSLLSNNSWGSSEPDFTALDHPQGLPLSSPEFYWPVDQQSNNPHIASKISNANAYFQ